MMNEKASYDRSQSHHVISFLIHRLGHLVLARDEYIRVNLLLETLVAVWFQVEHDTVSLSDQENRQESSDVSAAHPGVVTVDDRPGKAPRWVLISRYYQQVPRIPRLHETFVNIAMRWQPLTIEY